MRRALLIALAVALLAPASAHSATVALEGTELVYRSEPGQKDTIALDDDAGVLTVGGPRDA